MWLLSMFILLNLAACSNEESANEEIGDFITIAESDCSISFDAAFHSHSIAVSSNAVWKATLKKTNNWLTFLKAEGEGGNEQLNFEVSANTSEEDRDAIIIVKCGSTEIEINVTQSGATIEEMDPKKVQDLDRFHKPKEFSNMNMFRKDAKWSWFRSKQSEHFVVFWEAGFGDNPKNAAPLNGVNMKVDIDDLLVKAEQFFTTNVEVLKMAELGKGKSYLDKYKMEIYLLYSSEWLATGAGYDNVIGALWVNPSTCQPVGSVIAHEIGHSFQYQVYCDKLYQGGKDDLKSGFRYGFGPNGEGGCAYWEQCAQWQSFQDYPAEQFGDDINVFKSQYQRHFHHEWMRYASYWLQSYWVEKYGVEAYGEIWRESEFPEDAIKTYTDVFNGGDWEKTKKDLYDYAARMATFDIDGVREYADASQGILSTTLFKVDDGAYQVSYMSCPSTTGFNVIPLNLPEDDNQVSVTFEGLVAGSALPEGDEGNYLDGDLVSKKVSQTTYNKQGAGKEGWKYGFVALKKDGTRVYGDMNEGKVGTSTANFEVPANTERLFLVVLGAPTEYSQQEWDDDCKDDDQWPYRVKFTGTDLLGNFELDESKDPTDEELTFDVNCNASSTAYPQGTLDLSANKDLAQAFVMNPSEIAGLLQGVNTQPSEGKIVWGLLQTDGSFSYSNTANGGFWCDAEGNNSAWGDNGYIYVEFSGLTITYGHYPGHCTAGKTYTVKPTLIYTKGGKQYKVTITINMKF